jgi:hypothetical protein
LLTDKRFCRPAKYPIFPVLISRGNKRIIRSLDAVSSADFSGWFDSPEHDLTQTTSHTSFPPELYAAADLLHGSAVKLPDWCRSTPEFVYLYRKSLETAELSPSIGAWIGAQFGVSAVQKKPRPPDPPFKEVTQRRLREGTIDRAGVIGNFQSMVFVFANGHEFEIALTDWRTDTSLSKIQSLQNVEYSDELQIVVGENFLVGYDNGTMTVFKVAPDQHCIVHNFSLFVTAMAAFGSSIIFVVDFHDIFIAPAATFPADRRLFLSHTEAITRIVIDSTIGVVIVVTQHGKLRILSLLDGSSLGELDFNGRPVETVLVTENWHFILVESELKLYISTLRGTICKTQELFKPMVKATVFRTRNGHDYCAYVDSVGVLNVFEALYPDNATEFARLSDDIVALQYLRDQSFLLAVRKNGRVTIVPLEQIGESG